MSRGFNQKIVLLLGYLRCGLIREIISMLYLTVSILKMPSFEQLNLPGLTQMLAVAGGGLVGSLARYLTGHYLALAFGTSFPWGTMVVNFLGTALLTFVVTVALNKPGSIDPGLRFFLSTGFAGGFTTFSALAFETFSFYQKGEVFLASINIGGNLLLGVIAVIIGLVLAKSI